MRKKRAVDLYTKRGLSTHQVGEIIGVSATTVRRWLQWYGVPLRTRSKAVKLRRNRRFRLTPVTQALIDGIMLGGGRLVQGPRGEARLCLRRSAGALKWLEQLRRLLGQHSIEAHIVGLELRTCRYVSFTAQRDRWYPCGAKLAPQDLQLTTLVLAHWFFGAGCVGPEGRLVRLGARPGDAQRLADALCQTYGWNPRIHAGGRIALARPVDLVGLRSIAARHAPACYRAMVAGILAG